MTTRKTTSTNKTTKTTTSTRGRTTKATTTPEVVNEIVEETVEQVIEQPVTQPIQQNMTQRAVKAAKIDQNELIPCRSTQQKLIYISKRTNETIEWYNFGDVQYVSYGELVTMKATQPRFLKEMWIVIDDEEAINQLGLTKEYQNIFEIDDLDSFFNLSANKMSEILTNMPRGFKTSIAIAARERIQSGVLDSRNAIKVLEEKLDVDLKIFE